MACFVWSPNVNQSVHDLFFPMGSARLLNKPKTKAQTWFFYKQTNMNKLFSSQAQAFHEQLSSFTTIACI